MRPVFRIEDTGAGSDTTIAVEEPPSVCSLPFTGRQHLRVGMAGIDDGFKLRIGKRPAVDQLFGDARGVLGLGRHDRGQRRRLHEVSRMRLCAGDGDPLRPIGFVDRFGDCPALGSDRSFIEFDGLRSALRNLRSCRLY